MIFLFCQKMSSQFFWYHLLLSLKSFCCMRHEAKGSKRCLHPKQQREQVISIPFVSLSPPDVDENIWQKILFI